MFCSAIRTSLTRVISQFFHAKTFIACIGSLIFTLMVVCAPLSAQDTPAGVNQPEAAKDVPKQLQAWIPWVLAQDKFRNCAPIGESPRCEWPRALSLRVTAQGAEFALEGVMDRRAELRLPGSGEVIPTAVQFNDGTPVIVTMKDREPWASLPAGEFRIEGTFSWSEMPKRLMLPPATALVMLEVLGKRIENPLMDERGEVWFAESAAPERAEQDAVQAAVFRKLDDGVPFRILTQASLRISGKVRELVLGEILPPQSTLVRIDAGLAVQVDPKRGIVIQARPGQHRIVFESLLQKPPSALSVPKWQIPEFSGEEIWVWQPSEEFRSVQLEGGVLIDPARTEMPAEWNGLTTYALEAGQSLSFQEVRRGEVEEGANSLSLERTVWLPLSGKGLLVRDHVTGTMSQDWRLDALPSLEVGRVTVNGEDQLITKSQTPDSVGVELRARAVDLTAESRLQASLLSFPVVSWNLPMDRVSMTVNLPPGWSVVHAAGADHVSFTWLSSWSLLDVFMVLLVAIATWKLVGRKGGVLVLLGLVLLHQQGGSPQMIYFHLVGAFALVTFLPESGFKRFVRFHYAATLLLFGVLVATFSFHHIIQALFPSVLPPGANLYGFLEPFFYLIESTFSGWVTLTLFVWGAQLFFTGSFFAGILYGVVAAALTVVVGLSASFTGVSDGYHDTAYNLQRNVTGQAYMSERFSSLEASIDSAVSAPISRQAYSKQKALQTIDPQAVVQTGPGLPEWDWRVVTLNWNGRVESGYEASLITVGPVGHAILSFIRVAILIALLFVFVGRSRGRWWVSLSVRGASAAASIVAGFIACASFAPSITHAEDFPSQELLQQLRTRLDEGRCVKDCAAINQLNLQVEGNRYVADLRASAQSASAIGLPGPVRTLSISSVLVAGQPARALRRESDGTVWVKVDRGVHSLRITGTIRPTDTASIQFPMNPQHVSVNAPAWNIDGVSPTGSVQQSIQLTKKVRAGSASSTTPSLEEEASSWFSVSRYVAIGLPWEVLTTVTRSGNLSRPEMISIPLLDGESVVTPGLVVSGNKIQMLFPRGKSELRWESTLKPQEKLTLTAVNESRTTEVWEVRCAALWSCAPSGLAPERSVLDEQSGWRFRPFPTESVSFSIARPLGAPGQSLTVARVNHEVTEGVRSLDGVITMSLRASQGAVQPITLPEGAELRGVTVDGQDQTNRFQGNALRLPVKPGESSLVVSYSVADDRGLSLRAPKIGIEGTAANVTTIVRPAGDRWLLFTFGPGMGPAVLFWAKLIAVLLFAVILGRLAIGPFHTRTWILLGLGLATLPIPLMLVPVLWVWLLERRRSNPSESVFHYNLMQIALGVLTLVVLMLLFRAVETGLILSPDMIVRGKGSGSGMLSWYVDYSAENLPDPLLITIPMWCWRAVMLAWSMWLVFSLIAWLSWAFSCVSSGGLWKASPPKPVSVTPSDTSSAQAP